MKILLIQSYLEESQQPCWIKLCLESVKRWSKSKGIDYRFVDDSIFECVPSWYMEKVRAKLPVATDYARLVLLQKALEEEGYDQAIWLDADTLIFDQSLSLEFEGSCAFGQEVWVQEQNGKLRGHKNVHNAVCVFNRGCPVLPFLIHTVASIIRRVDPDKLAPQMVGPKLLTALNNITGFALLPQIGALSPEVAQAVINGEGRALDILKGKSVEPLKAINLCASLIDVKQADQVVKKLQARGRV